MKNWIVSVAVSALLTGNTAMALDENTPEGDGFLRSTFRACVNVLSKPQVAKIATEKDVRTFCTCLAYKGLDAITHEDIIEFVKTKLMPRRVQTMTEKAQQDCAAMWAPGVDAFMPPIK
jgi:hypothetical protein